ncbi:MAG: 2-oxo acid dehydrogenase subunit E2 [Deltaproteobacteria bacterium]|nr:2-oxo acid dehydrogenase subunit E2 [Deltaproteobacteria bacterium]MBW1952215.1 2-oxo acid dehydrogenase subunit E2 [Deltaproteobacteria bacterium]MBW1985814.1 2-oxo acid dehydrogenase subunit E2 [Deltaproteobacteria bacterium]MBW2133868.1 2-oxo acid dehydrogenase subunit E2 [Deltaproteobacteria bacterium]
MPLEFKLPDVGEGLTEGELLAWLVKEGDRVREGQPLARIETDKAVVEIPAPRDGVVLKLVFAEGATIKVGEVFVILGDPGEAAAPTPPTGVGVVGELEEAPPEGPPSSEEPKRAALATPVVRKLAKELGIDLAQVRGSGPEGRILEDDVRQAAAPSPPAVHKVRKYDLYGYIEHVPFKGMRRTIARNVSRSFQSTVPVTAMDEADITELFALKQRERQVAQSRGIHLTLLPFIIRAVIPALQEQPFLNATLNDQAEEIILKKYYNIGIATDTPAGLMVPVIKNAGDKSILELAAEIQSLAVQARDRSIDIADLQGGTFTITNYGAVGGLWGTPIMNYPEVGILGVGRRQELPRVWQGEIQIRHILPLVLTFDHRVVDGGQAARFLRQVVAHLEDPVLMLVGG